MFKALFQRISAIIPTTRPASQPASGHLRISDRGVALIKEFEGCKLTAYRCPSGILTIGFGSTGRHVTPGLTITQERAEELLREDLVRFEDAVRKHAGRCTQGQFDALTSFAFNLGIGALRGSTLLKKHRAGDYAGAALEFAKWNKARVKGVLKVLPGLSRRRAAEAAMYRA